MSDVPDAVEAAIGQVLGTSVRITRRTPLGGGSINDTARIDTTAGRFVVKANASAPPGLFQAEADGLAALRTSGTSLVIPRVIAVETTAPAFLVLEYLEPGRRRADFDEALGRGLAELHRASGVRFGFTGDNYCGATSQPNPWTDRWVDFYRDARLGYQLEQAAEAGHVSVEERAQVARILLRLGDWIAEPAEGPALIHGDLWSGNLHTNADGHPALVDPAVYYAHREAELGMMTLFGGFSSRVFAAYDEAFPLEAGWRDRNPLYQLYHLMNHLNLFGGSYHGQVMSIVRRYASGHG